jgi:hypothetical protein
VGVSSDKVAVAYVHGSIPRRDREDHDFFGTPRVGTEKLLQVEEFPGIVWEPACGDGRMSVVLSERCCSVVSTDVVDRGFPMARKMDFLTDRPDFPFDCIVTNPPYTHTLAFCQRALSFEPQKVAMLARLTWLEGKSRKRFFETSGLTRVHVFSERINMPRESVRHEYPTGKGGMVAYAWYVWVRGHEGPPTLSWI